MKKSLAVRLRAFRIWQELGFFPWRKEKKARKQRKKDFYKGAFDDIPFLNDDAKRTFAHLLLRPGYMIRDYTSGQHERYLAPLTALIIFYAFFGLISAVLQPVQQQKENPFDHIDITIKNAEKSVEEYRAEKGEAEELQQTILLKTYKLLRAGYLYLHLDEFPEEVDTRHEASIAAFEGKLRSQGIPLFLGKFLLLWLAMWLALRKRHRQRFSACATASAYALCQFSFFMLFVLLLSFGKQTSVSIVLLLALLVIDYHQWLGLTWRKSIGRAVATGIRIGIIYGLLILLISVLIVSIALLS
ncbi:MAG: DUF3667 domain-containing protein [Desulfovibrio sp.]|nr:DUF3667 domain-containing protein [Desulfovibrio sp.]